MKKIKSIFRLLTFTDIVLIILLLLISGFLSLKFSRKLQDKKIVVYHDREILGEFNLSVDRIETINEHITIEINNGRVRMLKSDCKNQHCVKQGWSKNLPIICVPNKITIVIEGRKQDKMLITS